MQRALVVSIHDVAPATLARVAEIVRQLESLGVSRTSLLVVPDYHRQGKALENRPLRAWLEERASCGDEIVLHGYFHERARRRGEGARSKLMTRFYTADEGEFYDLPYAEALRLISEARAEFQRAGFSPGGFIAPAWLLGSEAARAAKDAGMNYTTTLRTVRDLVSGEEFTSQSLVYSTRSQWRRAMSLGWNRWLFVGLTNNPLLRLSLHPPDISHRMICRQICEFVRRALRGRVAMTYCEWLTQQVIPSEAEGSRDASVKLPPRDPSTALHSARDDGEDRDSLGK